MAQDRELVPLQALPADERQADGQQGDERWPVPYALMVIAVVSVALWSLIFAAANWMIG